MINKISNDLSKKMKDNNTIYVLKGFNSIVTKLNIQLEHIFNFNLDKSLTNILNIDKKYITQEFQKLYNSGRKFYCLYEEMLYVEKKFNIPELTDYKIVIINLNCFDYYYPGFISETNEKYLEIFNDDRPNNNELQKIYTEFKLRNGCAIIAYNIVEEVAYEEIQFISSYTDDYYFFNHQEERKVELYDNSLPEIFIQIFNDICFGKYNAIKYIQLESKNNATVKKYLSILNQFEINIFVQKEERNVEKPKLYNDYLEILKRKNNTYDFQTIKMYENPFKSNKIIDLNQSVIIDDIYQNIIKAKNKDSFKDIFVTAPTGAGKSILFQIPAIMAAERNNLITIVISPLIGLMKDQVNNISDMTSCAVTINSEYTPLEKENIKEKIRNGESSIIYISPESLLSNSDIKTFIGERDIGLLVIDEAHTVATWGKNFRPDYWYLGDYLDKLRHSFNYIFPIATFTATSTISDNNDDMYHDIIESLNMTCDTFFGNVKRNEDIKFDIRNVIKDHAYLEEKNNIVIETINKYINSTEKTIVYFPYVKTLNDIYSCLNKDKVDRYFGNLDKFDKDEALDNIRNGKKNVVLATKAFGMGIDVKDIKNVYHFAPTGNLADYVQEIGRVARQKGMVGIASIDFFEEDFKYINKLYGMSQITNYNVIGVLKKIEDKYKKENKRNFMVSADEFAHVFKEDKEEDIENRLKATIIAIKKDFKSMSSYVPLIFKPRSMFTKGLFWISNSSLEKIKSYGWEKYLEAKYSKGELKKLCDDKEEKIIYYGHLYEFDFKRCWEDHYNGKYDGITFGNFKRKFFEGELDGIDKTIFHDRSLLTVDCKRNNRFSFALKEIIDFLDIFKEALDDMKMSKKHLTTTEIAEKILLKAPNYNKNRIKNSIEPILTMLISYDINIHGFGYKFCEHNKKTNRYNVKNSNYERDIYTIKESIRKYLEEYLEDTSRKSLVDISSNSNQMRKNPLLIAIQMMELLDLITYIFESGNKPEFFVRVNSENTILKVINNENYQSKTLATIGNLHYDSVRYMKYFFERLRSDEDRWNFIEDYFLGKVEEKYNIPKDIKTNIKQMDIAKEKSDAFLESIEQDKDIEVFVVFNSDDDITEKYYISTEIIESLQKQGVIKLSPGAELANQLRNAETGKVFNINGFEYLLEKKEYYDKKLIVDK